MSDVVEKLLELPPEDLKRWCRKKKKYKRKGRRKFERPKRTKEQLAEYLKKSGFRTRDELRNGRREGDPTDYDYCQAYGSWSAAVEEVLKVGCIDREFVIKSIIEFNLWRREDYREARAKRPDIFPSERAIMNNFGGWIPLKKMAATMSFKKTIEQYIKLKKRLKRIPTKKRCESEGVVIDSAIKVLGSKREFDEFIDSLENIL